MERISSVVGRDRAPVLQARRAILCQRPAGRGSARVRDPVRRRRDRPEGRPRCSASASVLLLKLYTKKLAINRLEAGWMSDRVLGRRAGVVCQRDGRAPLVSKRRPGDDHEDVVAVRVDRDPRARAALAVGHQVAGGHAGSRAARRRAARSRRSRSSRSRVSSHLRMAPAPAVRQCRDAVAGGDHRRDLRRRAGGRRGGAVGEQRRRGEAAHGRGARAAATRWARRRALRRLLASVPGAAPPLSRTVAAGAAAPPGAGTAAAPRARPRAGRRAARRPAASDERKHAGASGVRQRRDLRRWVPVGRIGATCATFEPCTKPFSALGAARARWSRAHGAGGPPRSRRRASPPRKRATSAASRRSTAASRAGHAAERVERQLAAGESPDRDRSAAHERDRMEHAVDRHDACVCAEHVVARDPAQQQRLKRAEQARRRQRRGRAVAALGQRRRGRRAARGAARRSRSCRRARRAAAAPPSARGRGRSRGRGR